MPRRGGGGRSMGRSPSPSRPAPPPAPRPAAHPPAAAPPQAMMQPQQRQPGLMAQMATTAAGVAVGSAVGHTIGHAMTGGGGSQEAAPAPVQDQSQMQPAYQQYQPPAQQDPNNAVCGLELKQFLECTQNQSDLSLCQGFNQVLRECRIRNGMTS